MEEKRDLEEATVEEEAVMEGEVEAVEEVTVEVAEVEGADMAVEEAAGDGIARFNNFVIFVPGTNTGDKVKVRITGVRNNFATGEVVTGASE